MSMNQQTRQQLSEKLKRLKPFNACLGCEVEPKLGIKESLFVFYCPECGWRTGAFKDFHAALADWHRSNRPNDSFIAERWASRFEQLKREVHV